ncbi:hypothetical protein HOC01_01875 [archaeon]|jgi:hypothetical protein|nr:hypothetical protein [archaeon]MBT6697931.1 hypothetical protein [archaeon]
MGKISIDTPLAELTLRRYEKPAVTGRELVRRVCLSLGLLQPGDSRDVMVDILYVLLRARQRSEELHSEEIKFAVMSIRKEKGLPMLGIASSNIRRQLKRLKDMHLIESNANLYRIMENAGLGELFRDKIEGFILKSVLGRVREYLKSVDEEFSLERVDEAEPIPKID